MGGRTLKCFRRHMALHGHDHGPVESIGGSLSEQSILFHFDFPSLIPFFMTAFPFKAKGDPCTSPI